ncbi:MAG: hypothetical protein ABI671_01410, partial [Burkholderiales bacterium]
MIVRLLLAALALLVGAEASAQYATVFLEQGQLVRASQNVTALGPDLMGDKVNLYTGAVEFNQTDVSLPGNNTLPVAVGRRYVTGIVRGSYYEGLFADWDLEIPHLHGTFSSAGLWVGWIVYGADGKVSMQRCSRFSAPPVAAFRQSSQTVDPDTFWSGSSLYVPSIGDQKMLARDPQDSFAPNDGQSYPIVTKSKWQIRCITGLQSPKTTANTGPSGEGFVALSPDGTQYRFDWIATRPYVGVSGPDGATGRNEIWIMPTLVTDRFGNTVTYTYDTTDPWKLLGIVASDGRQLTLTYGGGHRVASVTDNTRTWLYGYGPAVVGSSLNRLNQVVLPDASAWGFDLQGQVGHPQFSTLTGCYTGITPNNTTWQNGAVIPAATSSVVTHPSGAVGTFNMQWVTHGRSGMLSTNANPCPSGPNLGPTPEYAVRSITSKSISGPGLTPLNWTYAWGAPNGSWYCGTGCPTTTTLAVTDPRGAMSRYTFGNRYLTTEGQLLQIDEGWDGNSSALRSTTYAYRLRGAGPYPSSAGNSGSTSGDDLMETSYLPQYQRSISQQGVSFTAATTAFDTIAGPVAASRSSSLGYSKTETTAYSDNTARWAIGQIASRAVNGITSARTSFDSATGLPSASYQFGKLKASYAFNADGTLRTVTDGLNHTTTYAGYKRGLAQTITYADNTSVSATVNDIGMVTSLTNEAGTTTSYGYDAIGRLARITPPGGDPVVYNPTTIAYQQWPGDEYGIAANHWRQTITTGTAVTVNYFDAMLRKRISSTSDTSDPGNTRRAQLNHFDADGRNVFASYPARSIASIGSTMPGTTTTYDPLGRPTRSVSDSDLGGLTTTTDYLSGFQKKVTDPRGSATTMSYQAFDEPSESAIASITAPETVGVVIQRDVFGKSLTITRSGSSSGVSVSATRSYVYDTNQLLCKTIEPEVGATVQVLDAANNLAWRGTGLKLPSTGSCDTGSVPAAKIIGYTYDNRNRLTGTGFGDGSTSIGRAYTPDGLPSVVVSGASTWNYAYNNRRLPTLERLSFNGNFDIAWVYDANAHVTQLTYPGGYNVTYSPNALGEATQVSGYASGVRYQPNGAVATYTLGAWAAEVADPALVVDCD